jgi:hypothetical protein
MKGKNPRLKLNKIGGKICKIFEKIQEYLSITVIPASVPEKT